MKYDYHSLFIAAPQIQAGRGKRSNNMSHEVDGVAFTRDVHATILDMSKEGYELVESITVTSTRYHQIIYTEGATLIFRKEL